MTLTQGKPHIAILHYSAPPIVGGVEAVIAEVAERLAAWAERDRAYKLRRRVWRNYTCGR